jgi:D-tyrosyl-tRNA(Tyr) deacylase
MRAVVQRVKDASVRVDGSLISKIDSGLLVLLGVTHSDTQDDIDWLSKKILNLRIFNDEEWVMNKSLLEVDQELIVVSQFTLYAATKKGNRPSYINAAKPEQANELYKGFVASCERQLGKKVGEGVFGADMKVSLMNDGPVTISIDTHNRE